MTVIGSIPDFGAVLGFHAQKRLEPDFNYKSSQSLSRIAKRGYPELKQTITAIDDEDFNGAKKLECKMCLLIA